MGKRRSGYCLGTGVAAAETKDPYPPAKKSVMPSDVANFHKIGLPSFASANFGSSLPNLNWIDHPISINGCPTFWLDSCVLLHKAPPKRICQPPPPATMPKVAQHEPLYLTNYATLGIPAHDFSCMKASLATSLSNGLKWKVEETTDHVWVDVDLPTTFSLSLSFGDGDQIITQPQASEGVKGGGSNLYGSMLIELHARAHCWSAGDFTAGVSLLQAHLTRKSPVVPEWQDMLRLGKASSPTVLNRIGVAI